MYAYMMYLLDNKPMALQTAHCNKQHSALSVNGLGWDIARQIIHKTYSHTICADASQGYLTDVSCPGRT